MKIITCCTTLVAIIQLSLMRVVESLLRDGLPARLTIRPSPPSSTVPISPLTTAPHPTRKWNHGANNCLTTNTRTITRSQRLYLATPNPRRKSGDSVYGQGRGSVLLGVVLLLNVWIFSIPPYFRRVHWCATPTCIENHVACDNCVTVSEWTAGIAEYYRNGGGIEFDFTIAPETKKFWDDALGGKR